MTTPLHELRGILAQALNKIDEILSAKPSPHLAILTEWLTQATDQQMRASQLYVLVKEEFHRHDLTEVTQQDIADALRHLGYVNRRTAHGMKWSKP